MIVKCKKSPQHILHYLPSGPPKVEHRNTKVKINPSSNASSATWGSTLPVSTQPLDNGFLFIEQIGFWKATNVIRPQLQYWEIFSLHRQAKSILVWQENDRYNNSSAAGRLCNVLCRPRLNLWNKSIPLFCKEGLFFFTVLFAANQSIACVKSPSGRSRWANRDT